VSGKFLLRQRRAPGTRRSLRTDPLFPVATETAGPVTADRPRALGWLSDEALLAEMGGVGSTAALWELFQRHGAAVHRLASLLDSDPVGAERLVEDVFVTLARRSGRLEDDVENVRLGLLAMAWRRSRPADDAVRCSPPAPASLARSEDDAAAIARLQSLPSKDRDALALTVLGAASLTDVAVVLAADRRAIGSRLRTGLCDLESRGATAAS